ncbi:NACHT domain- and WD repeat-containing protein 1-like [Nothobranchius furzeri]|uniref:NACHT domain- and WD repeat-containing protein 1-like n=1 Tax=Nothobranchius furzeri TaxID=105023 RepID=UPI0039048678
MEAGRGGDNCLQDILRGRSDGTRRTTTNMIRVFLSSTFTDMSSERRHLLDKAHPEILAFCRRLGLVYEVVDLRWGIRNVLSGDHKAREIFLKEIQTCRRLSAGPVFVVSGLNESYWTYFLSV